MVKDQINRKDKANFTETYGLTYFNNPLKYHNRNLGNLVHIFLLQKGQDNFTPDSNFLGPILWKFGEVGVSHHPFSRLDPAIIHLSIFEKPITNKLLWLTFKWKLLHIFSSFIIKIPSLITQCHFTKFHQNQKCQVHTAFTLYRHMKIKKPQVHFIIKNFIIIFYQKYFLW